MDSLQEYHFPEIRPSVRPPGAYFDIIARIRAEDWAALVNVPTAE